MDSKQGLAEFIAACQKFLGHPNFVCVLGAIPSGDDVAMPRSLMVTEGSSVGQIGVAIGMVGGSATAMKNNAVRDLALSADSAALYEAAALTGYGFTRNRRPGNGSFCHAQAIKPGV